MPPLLHARLGASNAHRWMNCTGAPRMAEGLPEIEEEYQIEGRAAHGYAEHWLKEWEEGGPELDHVWVDTEAGKREYPVDAEMREGVGLFVKTVLDAYQALGGELLIEQRVGLSLLGRPEMFGTADVILHAKRILRVFDLKYGRGVIVEVRNNEQLLYYVLGAILKVAYGALIAGQLEVVDGDDFLERALTLFDEITVTIVQPRAPHVDGPVRTWQVERAEIAWYAQHLLQKAEEASGPDAPLTPGDWCRFCPAQGSCPALKQRAQLVAQVDFDAVPLDTPPSPEHLSVEVVADMLTQVPILEAWIAAMYKRVTTELEAGRPVPGWKLVNKRATRKWADPAELEKWGRAVFGKEFELTMYQRELLSPAQVEKIVGKGNLPAELVSKESSGTNLVPDSDPRPAAAVGASEVFALLPPSPAKEADTLNG